MIRPDDPDAEVRELLRQPRPIAVDAARAARVRPAVHAAWKHSSASPRYWKRYALLAAALVIVVTGVLLLDSRRESRIPIATASFVTDDVVFRHDGETRAGLKGDALRPGTLITTNRGRASIVLLNGVELRLDANTAITLDAAKRVTLKSGALYLDSSHRTGPAEAVDIVARGSVIRDIGTRYEIRLSEHEVRVRVRDGRVEVDSAFGKRETDRGGQLSVTSSGIVAGRASLSGSDWDWIVRATRQPRLEGRPLPAFLAWAEGEGGLPIRFADPALEQANAETIVYGAIDGLTVEEALDVVLPSCGLARRTENDVITIVAADDVRVVK